jgi:hypothetical protein
MSPRVVFEGHMFQTALFVQNSQLLKELYEVRSRALEAHFRLLLAAMEKAINLESLSSGFQFVELGQQVGEFLSRHCHVEVVRLKSVIAHLERRDRELCPAAEANEQDSRLEGLPGAIGDFATKQQHELEKVSGLQKAMVDVRRQMNQTEEAVMELDATKDRTSRVESDLGGPRAAMAEKSTTVEEVRREVASLRAQLSD